MAPLSFAHTEVNGLVSIVMPAHRSARLIGETLATIGAQSYSNWELLVVEDGSHDGTEDIVREFARQHPEHRIEYRRNDRNRGPSHSRNVAFAEAKGEFVALLDSDDRWFPDHLAGSVKALRSSGKDIAYSTVVMFEDKTELILGTWGPTAHELADFPQSLFGRSFITPSATVLRRSVLADVGPWDVDLRCCEDFHFWLRSVAAGKQFCCVGGCHCEYRKNHAESATSKFCWIQETLAQVSERFLDLPGARPNSTRRFVSMQYALAARYHATSNPKYDPSADASRAPRLWLKAWRLRPKRVGYLLSAAMQTVKQLRRRRAAVPAAPTVHSSPSPTKVAA